MPGIPNYPKDMGTEWMKLKTEVKNAFTSANSRVPYARITAGVLEVASSFKMLAGSFMRFDWASGQLGMILGQHQTGGDQAEGIFIRRNDGKLALWIFNRIDDGYGYTAIYDQDTSPNGIFTDDGASKKGIGRPWLASTFANVSELTSPPAARITGGTTDVAVVTAFPNIQHPYIYFVAYVYTAVGGAVVEYKFKDPGLGTTLFTGTSTDGYVSGYFAINSDHDFGTDKHLDLTIRRSSGSGNVGITLISLLGRQSP